MINLDAQKEWFKNHVAIFTDLGNIKILDFKNPDSCCYYIRFLHFKSIEMSPEFIFLILVTFYLRHSDVTKSTKM